MKETGTLRRDRQTDRQTERQEGRRRCPWGAGRGAGGEGGSAAPPYSAPWGWESPRPASSHPKPERAPQKRGGAPSPDVGQALRCHRGSFLPAGTLGGPSPGLARPEFGRCFLGILQPRGCSCPNPDSSCWPWLGSALPPGHGVVVLHVRPAIKRDGLGVSSCLLDDHWRGKNGEMSWNRAWPGQENLPLSPSAVPGDMPAPSQPLERFYWGFRAGELGAGSCFCSQPT